MLNLVALLLSTSALACMHYKPDYKVIEGTKHVFMFHDGRRAHLIVNTDLKTDQQSLPDRLAWVLPFPVLPDQYEESDPKIFVELGNLVSRYSDIDGAPVSKGGRGAEQGASASIQVHETKYVGHYEIHPIEILSTEDHGKALNDWLASNEFIPMPADLQEPYLKKGAVFLAVNMSLKGLKKANLKPLHVTYRAENLIFPLRFTHDTRTFDIDFFVYTPWNMDTPWDRKRSEMPDKYLTRAASTVYKPEYLGKSAKTLRKLLGKQIGYLYKYEGRGLNGEGKKLRELKDDPFIVPQ